MDATLEIALFSTGRDGLHSTLGSTYQDFADLQATLLSLKAGAGACASGFTCSQGGAVLLVSSCLCVCVRVRSMNLSRDVCGGQAPHLDPST